MRRKALTAVVVVLVVLVVAAAAFLILWYRNGGLSSLAAGSDGTGGEDDSDSGEVYYDGAWYKKKPGLESYLIMGLDEYESTAEHYEDTYTNNEQADFLLLVLFDKDENDITALQLNRDTMAEMSRLNSADATYDTVEQQLALAYSYGSGGSDSCINEVNAVSTLLYGVTIDHYVAITMDAIP
ncbi:MAG: LCP family protein, partial [Bacteroidales bacterium]|nr:LCP family protein [Bacteroidales bacterium]